MDMEDGSVDVSSKQVYVMDKHGHPKRDTRIEINEKILDIKKGLDCDNIENVNYMPNSKYNIEATIKIQRHMANLQRKKEEQEKEEILR